MQDQSLRRRLGILAGAALVLAMVMVLSPLPVSAHHGWGGYLDAEFEISGTVDTPVSVAGPHATMQIRADDGHVSDVVLAPTFRTKQAEMKAGHIPFGSKVTVHGHRHRDDKRLEINTARVT